jgi:hypothetical protein
VLICVKSAFIPVLLFTRQILALALSAVESAIADRMIDFFIRIKFKGLKKLGLIKI